MPLAFMTSILNLCRHITIYMIYMHWKNKKKNSDLLYLFCGNELSLLYSFQFFPSLSFSLSLSQYFSMEGDYIELSQFPYNFYSTRFLTSGIRAIDFEMTESIATHQAFIVFKFKGGDHFWQLLKLS